MTILENVELKQFNTFGINATAKYFTSLRSEADIQETLNTSVFKNERHLILGGGSNVLFTHDFKGLVAKVELSGINVVGEDDNTVALKVGAGENWHAFVRHCVSQNWGGVENLSLIPGTVGAAPMQNIGAYGVEIKNIISQVEAVEIDTGRAKIFTNADCQFGYRESIFKQQAMGKYLISSVTLILTKRNHRLVTGYGTLSETLSQNGNAPFSIQQISDAVIQIRSSKLPDPSRIGNAGSFFKNPSIHAELHDFIKKEHPTLPSYPAENNQYKIPAAWLIEQCGWKGKTFNNIGVHKHQALVLVNYGGGKGDEIWELAMNISDSVKAKFDIILQPEVNVVT